MGSETEPKRLEQNSNRHTVVLTVRGKEERISGTFRIIQMLNVLDSARKKRERVLEKDLQDLNEDDDSPPSTIRSQFNRDFRLLRKNLNSHGAEIVTLGKKGAREYSWEEIPQQPEENSLDQGKEKEPTPTVAPVKSVERQSFKNISSNGRVNDISEISVLPEAEKHRQIAEIEANLAHMAISRLMKSSGLKESNRSPFKLLKKVAPEGTTLESLQGIWTHGELVEYIIECITKTVETIRKTGNSASLSKKEQQISDDLYLLSEQGYNQQKIERVIRIIFSIPPPASVPAPAAARAN